MSYNGNENAIDCSFSEEDFLKSAKAHIHGFIEILIGIAIGLALLGLLLSTLIGTISCIGGCFGCEACIETAGCADELLNECFGDCDGCIECNYQEMTEENVANANDCVSCDGIDCFGREGCFACDGCGDCSSCGGTKYYSITVQIRDEEYGVKIEESETYIPLSIPGSTIYYEYQGLYDQPTGGTCYVDSEGNMIRPLQDNLKLYARYNEYNAGETYYFDLSLAAFGMADTTIQLTVGGALVGLPVAPEKEGYEFVGWYLDDVCVQSGNVEAGATFHLYNFEIDPSYENRTFTLRPVYQEKEYTITLVAYGYSYQLNASYNSTFGEVFNRYYNWYNDLSYDDSFFGWGLSEDTEPEEKVDPSTLITGDATVYAIFRQPVHYYFYYNFADRYYDYIDVKLREGRFNVYLADLEELESVMNDESIRPGYKFVGWYADSNPSQYSQPVQTIPVVEESKSYYAQWEETDYEITYKVTIGDETYVAKTERYYMSYYEDHTLMSSDDVPHNVGYEFGGWCETEDFSDTPKTYLPAGTYGTKTMYAYFRPVSYQVTLIDISGGVFSNGRNVITTNVDYGTTYTLEVPTKQGYNFLGFYYDNKDGNLNNDVQCTDGNGVSINAFTLESFGLTSSEEVESSLNKKISLYGKWDIQKFTVTFMNDDVRYEVQYEVPWNTAVSEPTTPPTKEGHDFKAWTYENGNTYNFSTVITGDLTLYAKFEIQKYVVTFIYDGATYTATQVPWGSTIAEAVAKTNVPADTDRRRLRGWYTTEALTTRVYEDTQIKQNNQTYYAKHQDATKFTFYGRAGTQEKYYFSDETYDFPTDSAVGYDFVGWCENESATGTVKNRDVRITDSMATVWYPKFTAISYTITYKYIPSGATTYVDYTTDSYTIAETKPLIAVGASNEPKRNGYDFTGWKESQYGVGNFVTELTATTGDKTYYAQYSAKAYTVSLYDKDGYVASTQLVTFDSTFDFGVPANKEGYNFVGWSYTQGGEVITDATGVSLPGVVYNAYAEDRNVYPVFQIKTYRVLWVDAETSETLDQTTANHFGRVTRIVDPSKTGYSFVNWYTSEDCTTEFDFANYEVTSNVRIHAKFTINSYSVTFSVGGEAKYIASELEYKSSLSAAMAAAQWYADDYATTSKGKFYRWESTNGTVYTADSLVPAENLTLKAIYQLPIYVNFVKHDGSVEKVGPYYNGDNIASYSYSNEGYYFNGWYTDGGTLNNEQSFPFTAEGNTGEISNNATEKHYTFYSKWTPREFYVYYYLDGWNYGAMGYTMDQVDSGLQLSAPTMSPGYDFDGWYVSFDYSSSGATKLQDNVLTRENVINGSGYFDDYIYCFGYTKKATYTITFIVNGVEQTEKTITIENGDSLPTLFVPSIGGYFAGWEIKSSPIPSEVGDMVADSSGWMPGYSTYYWTGNLVLEAIVY